MSATKISDSFSFKSAEKLSLPKTSEALKIFSQNFSKAFELATEFKYIFLDTNVLLNYYGMSKSEKYKLLDFFRINKERIFLTAQVEKEFLRNRLGTIQKDLDVPLKSLHKDYESSCEDAKNSIRNYLNSRKNTFSNDYPAVWDKLLEVSTQIDTLLNDEILNKAIIGASEEATAAHKNIAVEDELLEVCSQFNIMPSLLQDEIDILIKHYDELYEAYTKAPQKDQWKLVFPGSGDKKDKPDYPYGDFIIYHEMMKKMQEMKSDGIFLTNERSKLDWIQKDKSPNIHYIENSYSLTGNILYILHAESPLKVSFENIHKNKIEENKTVLESTVATINKKDGYGFLFKKGKNLYFNKTAFRVPGEFDELEKNSCLTYAIGKNSEGEDIAVNLKRIFYNFNDPNFIVEEGFIKNISPSKSFGYVEHDNDLLYFHTSAFIDSDNLELLEEGVSIQFIRGRDNEGHDIIRLFRLSVTTVES